MLTFFDDTDLFNTGKPKITHFNIPDEELTLHEQLLMDETRWKQEPVIVQAKPISPQGLLADMGNGEAVIGKSNPTDTGVD